jgi:hypothetical protein
MSKRPDMKNYFRAKIDFHVNGMMSNSQTRSTIPRDVKRINGDVTDSVIVVTMLDGTEWKWAGGSYAARKVNGCYAPLMPKPIEEGK